MKRIESIVDSYFEEKIAALKSMPMPQRLHKGGQLLTSLFEISELFTVHYYAIRSLCELRTKPEEKNNSRE